MNYVLHSEAEQDIAHALDFYLEQAGRVVADRFLAEFERTARLLIEYPDPVSLQQTAEGLLP